MRVSSKKILCNGAVALLIVFCGVSYGGVIGPNLPKGEFELGLQYRGVNRQISSAGTVRDLEGSDRSLYLRYGLTHTATLTGEALVLPDIAYPFDEDVGGTWRYYVLGAGLQMKFWERERWAVEAGFDATETLWFSDRNNQCVEKWLTMDWVMIGTYVYRREKVEIVVWGGPGYFYVNRTVLASAVCSRMVWESDNNWGGTAGLNVLFYDHVRGSFSFVYTDNFEPRFGLSYLF
jgi:hypothetical protein